MARLSDIQALAVQNLLGNQSVGKATLAINAAAAATVKTTAAYSYSVGGVWYTKAALAAQSIAPTHTIHGTVVGGAYVQPVSTTVYYTIALNAAGAVAVVQGSFAGQNLALLNIGTSFVGDGFVPDVPAGYTPVGVIKVVTNGATTFTPGTTALDAAGLTVSYFDIAFLPSNTL